MSKIAASNSRAAPSAGDVARSTVSLRPWACARSSTERVSTALTSTAQSAGDREGRGAFALEAEESGAEAKGKDLRLGKK
jgi:hypothetical protein